MSRLLLDTHALLWWTMDHPQLSPTAKAAITDPGNECYLSTASTWEMAIKCSLGKLCIDGGLARYLRRHLAGNRIRLLSIEAPHTLGVLDLPWHHRDPFDRLLVAQCLVEDLTLVSADASMTAYGVPLLW